MRRCVWVKVEGDTYFLYIRPPGGGVSFIALFGIIFIAAVRCWDGGTHMLDDLSFFMLLIAITFLVVRQLFFMEEVEISVNEIVIRKKMLNIDLSVKHVLSVKAGDVLLVKNRYRSKGHYTYLYRLIFFSEGRLVAKSYGFSEFDYLYLMNGPIGLHAFLRKSIIN